MSTESPNVETLVRFARKRALGDIKLKRVLLVLGDIIAMMALEAIGNQFPELEFSVAHSPKEGLTLWEQSLAEGEPFSIVITGRKQFEDPGDQNPWELIRKIRQTRPETRIVGLAMMQVEKDRHNFEEQGVETLVNQPSDNFEPLIRLLREV